MIYLSHRDISQLLTPQLCIEALEAAFHVLWPRVERFPGPGPTFRYPILLNEVPDYEERVDRAIQHGLRGCVIDE